MLWLALSLAMAAALLLTFPLSRGARDRATSEAATQATTTARVALAPLLTTPDLEAPVTGDRYQQLSAAVREAITAPGPIQHVILWSTSGEVLYDDDQVKVGGHDLGLAAALTEVADGGPMSRVKDGALETYVPMWLEADGPVAVAQLDRPVGPVTQAADEPWRIATIVVASLLGLCLLEAAAALLRPDRRPTEPASTSAPRREPAQGGRRSRRGRAAPPGPTSGSEPEPAMAPATAAGQANAGAPLPPPARVRAERPRPASGASIPLYAHPDFKEFQRQTELAEDRARQAEDRLRELQEELRVAALDAAGLRERLTLRQSQLAAAEAELQDARGRIRDLEARVDELEGDGHVVVEAGGDVPRVILRSSQGNDEAARLSEGRGRAG